MTRKGAWRMALLALACQATRATGASPRDAAPLPTEPQRQDALARARVWVRPAVPVGEADLLHNPSRPGALPEGELLCTFREHASLGTSPKFSCVTGTGELIKVKMGLDNGEVFAEVAASRLMSALGFPTDEMYAVARVRCRNCPAPAQALRWWKRILPRRGPAEIVYETVAVERRPQERSLPGGWAWFELVAVDPRRGGATRAEVDALRLMAVFLAHWDNKPDNQRLACRGGSVAGSCAEPVAMVHDLGATFGPWKVSLASWRAQPIWSDPPTCTVSLRRQPFRGGTFPDAQIGEEGRALLASLLGELREEQIRDLFTGARFPAFTGHAPHAREVSAWTAAFQEKVKQIVDHRCPAAP